MKVGGRLVLNNIYSLDIKDEQLFEEAIYALGFDVVKEYTGEVTGGNNYLSKVFTLQKREYPGMSPQEIAKLIGTNHYNGFRIVNSKTKLNNTRKVLTEMSIDNGFIDEEGNKKEPLIFDVSLNDTDMGILQEEREITEVGNALKQQYSGIDKIPRDVIIENNFIRILVGNKYVLFKKVSNASGAVVIR